MARGMSNRVAHEVIDAQKQETVLRKLKKAREAEAQKNTVRVILDDRTIVFCSPDKVARVKQLFAGRIYGAAGVGGLNARTKSLYQED